MDAPLRSLLDRLYEDGLARDAEEPDRRRRRRNLEPDAATFLWVLLQSRHAPLVVEVGTSNGYSTIWLADAARRAGGRVVSVDVDSAVQREAAANLEAAGISAAVELRAGDGGAVLAAMPAESVDLLFLDAERPEYSGWWPAPKRVLRRGGLLVVDNVLSHPDEVARLRALVEADQELPSTVLGVGKGLLLAVRP